MSAPKRRCVFSCAIEGRQDITNNNVIKCLFILIGFNRHKDTYNFWFDKVNLEKLYFCPQIFIVHRYLLSTDICCPQIFIVNRYLLSTDYHRLTQIIITSVIIITDYNQSSINNPQSSIRAKGSKSVLICANLWSIKWKYEHTKTRNSFTAIPRRKLQTTKKRNRLSVCNTI